MRVIVDRAIRKNGISARMQRIARAVLIVALAALGVWIIKGFVPALIWAAILGVALWPVYQRALRAWPAGGHIALPAIFTLLVLMVFVVPLLLFALQAGRDAHDFIQWFQSIEHAGVPVPAWVVSIPMVGHTVDQWWANNLAKPFDTADIFHFFNRAAMVSLTREFGFKFIHRIVVFAFTLLTLFFLFKDGETLSKEMLRASHKMFGLRGEHIARQMVASIHGTVDGLVLVGIGEGVVMGIAYFFTGVPHPVLLGAVTAVAAMIPFGAVIAFGGASLFLVAQGSVGLGVVVFVLGLAVVGVADHFIRPVLIGGATKLPFLWVLLGILGGVETFGLLGLFLGPAVMSALILLWRELIATPAGEPGEQAT